MLIITQTYIGVAMSSIPFRTGSTSQTSSNADNEFKNLVLRSPQLCSMETYRACRWFGFSKDFSVVIAHRHCDRTRFCFNDQEIFDVEPMQREEEVPGRAEALARQESFRKN